MVSLLFPWFMMAVCIGGDGAIHPPQLFGPFDTLEQVRSVEGFLVYGLLCEPGKPERRWRWTNAVPINIPSEEQEIMTLPPVTGGYECPNASCTMEDLKTLEGKP